MTLLLAELRSMITSIYLWPLRFALISGIPTLIGYTTYDHTRSVTTTLGLVSLTWIGLAITGVALRLLQRAVDSAHERGQIRRDFSVAKTVAIFAAVAAGMILAGRSITR